MPTFDYGHRTYTVDWYAETLQKLDKIAILLEQILEEIRQDRQYSSLEYSMPASGSIEDK